MHWRARVVGPVLAGVLGVTGGVVTAVLTQPAAAPAFADPLGLGIPLRDLPCNGEAILVVGHGDTRAALDTGVANNAGQTRYLRTADSCQTQLNAENAKTKPAFIAYTGPYPASKLATPCALRMTLAHRTDYVAVLTEGNTQLVKCPCVLPDSAGPTVTTQTKPAKDSIVWVRSLQGMLHDDNEKAFPRSRITGVYDEFTRQYILTRFQTPAGYLGRGGVMDTPTWGIVKDQICPRYTY